MTVSDLVWYFGLFHLVGYGAVGGCYFGYYVFRSVGGIAKVIHKNRDCAVPRFEAEQ